MAVKLTFGEPVLVAMGPEYAKAGWGPYQFPNLKYLPDGRIALNYHVGHDDDESYGMENAWMVSEDNGSTWRAVPVADIPAIKACYGTKLPSGKYIKAIVHEVFPIEDELYERLKRIAGRKRNCVGIEEVPDGLFPKTWTFAVGEPGDTEETQYDCELDFPGMTVALSPGAIVRPMAFGPLRVAPDGSLWVAHYWHGRNPENLGYTSYYACYYFQSTDEGKSFKLKSWIPYLPDTNEFPEAFEAEGYCEPDLAFMPDGSMLTIIRTSSCSPSYLARSTDGGNTWSKPVKFDRCGVLPQLQVMGCGVTLATYGRPGLFVRATDDPSGQSWDAPIELMPYKDPKTVQDWIDSCYYTNLLPLDDRTVLMAYSDFNVKDETGTPRKSVLVRTIHIEE